MTSSYFIVAGTLALSNELSSLLRDVEVRKLDEEGARPWMLWLVTVAPLN